MTLGPHSWYQGLVRRPGGEEAGLDPLAAALDVLRVKNGPGLDFGHAGRDLRFHGGHGLLAGMEGAAHGLDLIRTFDGAGLLGHLFAVEQSETAGAQGIGALQHYLVDGKAPVSARVGPHQLVHLAGEVGGQLVDEIPRRKVVEPGPAAGFLDQGVVSGEVRQPLVLPDHHMPVGRHQDRTERIVRVPDLHIGGVGGVADVERVGQQQTAVVPGRQGVLQALHAIGPHRRQTGEL